MTRTGRRHESKLLSERVEMIRLLVLYNLADGADEAEFLDWRLNRHQSANAALPSVLRTDFALVVKAWPDGVTPRYRYVTTLDWPDLEAFNRAFYAPDVQAGLLENIKLFGDYEYFVSEILTSSESTEVQPS